MRTPDLDRPAGTGDPTGRWGGGSPGGLLGLTGRVSASSLRSGIALLGSTAIAGRLRAAGVEIGHGSRFVGRPIVDRKASSQIRIGARFLAISRSRATALGVAHPVVLRTLAADAVVEIGEDVGMSGGSICAARRVSIGDGCLLGANVTVVDTDFHPVRHPQRRYAPLPPARPEDAVWIGRNVFVGTGAVILKGSWIGDHAVIGAGAVVRGRVETGVVFFGQAPGAEHGVGREPTR